MKLMRYSPKKGRGSEIRLGVLVAGNLVGDLRAGFEGHLRAEKQRNAARRAAAEIPTDVRALLMQGATGLANARRAHRWLEAAAKAGAKEPFIPLDRALLHAPIAEPNKLIAVGRNYLSHMEEASGKVEPMEVPSAWIKSNSAIAGPMADIVKPRATRELDYETELSFVIGKRCRNVPEAKAYDVIAGYTIVNDVSARDVARLERKHANQLLGKMFDGFAPMGPWVVTKDEVRDPMALRLQTIVNGEVRQDSPTAKMIWSIPKLVAYISQMTLEPGDVITTGTPDGCAMGRDKGLPSWYLEPGHVLESKVEGIGSMVNRIVAEPDAPASWKWWPNG